jgi:hypothetical protein
MWVCTTVLALGIGLLVTAGRGVAEDEKDAMDGIVKMVESMAKGDMAGIKAGEATAKKAELLDVMSLFKPKPKGGLGTGGKHTPDGIEAWLIAYGRKGPSKPELDSKAADLEKAAHAIQAIGMVGKNMSPVKVKMGDKDPKKWVEWSEEMTKAAADLAAAAKAKKVDDIKAIVSKINSSCNSCHGVFRDS